MEPASTIISRLGGVSAVAAITGVHRTRVSNWKRAKDVGGTGGRIPQGHIPGLLGFASKNGIPLTAEEFFGKQERRAS